MKPFYCVRLTDSSGAVSYLRHRDRTSWGKRAAARHLAEFLARFPGYSANLEPAESYEN